MSSCWKLDIVHANINPVFGELVFADSKEKKGRETAVRPNRHTSPDAQSSREKRGPVSIIKPG